MVTTPLLIGFIIDIIGELMLAASVIMVHSKVLEEKKIDKAVQKGIRLEMKLGILAILLIIIGSTIQVTQMM